MELGKIGEVVDAGTARFTTQCYNLGEPPPLGSLVTTCDGNIDIFAVVTEAATASIDPSRRISTLGLGEETAEQIYQTHPELKQLLRTDFDALVVGHSLDGAIRHALPSRPAQAHAFVRLASANQVRDFTQVLHFLPFLTLSQAINTDHAVAAFLKLASGTHPDAREFLVRSGKALAGLLAQDSQRLQSLLRLLVS